MPLLSSCKVNLEGTDACDPYSLSSSGIPIPTEGQLRFEAFNALAYGAQGIAFWSYTQRTRNKDEKYFSAPIDSNGNRTIIWDRVCTINKEIEFFSDIFLGCDVIKVVHAGKQYTGTTPYSSKFGFIKNLETKGMGVVVSHLQNNNHDYIMIVNHDALNSQKIVLEFLDPESIIELSDRYDNPEDEPGDYTNMILGPGGYALFQVI